MKCKGGGGVGMKAGMLLFLTLWSGGGAYERHRHHLVMRHLENRQDMHEQLAKHRIFVRPDAIVGLTDSLRVIIKVEVDFNVLIDEHLKCNGTFGQKYCDLSRMQQQVYFKGKDRLKSLIQHRLDHGRAAASHNRKVLESEPGLENLQEEVGSGIRMRPRRGLFFLGVLFVFVAVAAVTALVIGGLNEVNIKRQAAINEKHIRFAEQWRMEQDALNKETRDYVKKLGDKLEDHDERLMRLEMAAQMNSDMEAFMDDALIGIHEAFEGTISSHLQLNATDIVKNMAYQREQGRIAPGTLIYDKEPAAVFELSQFSTTLVGNGALCGLLFIPLLRLSDVYIQAETIPVGHFTPDNDFLTPSLPSKIVYKGHGEEKDCSNTSCFYELDHSACHWVDKVHVAAMCKPWALQPLREQSQDSTCPIPPDGKCLWKRELVVPGFTRSYLIKESSYIVATVLQSYKVLETNETRWVRIPVDVYNVPPHKTFAFGRTMITHQYSYHAADMEHLIRLGGKGPLYLTKDSRNFSAETKTFLGHFDAHSRTMKVIEEKDAKLAEQPHTGSGDIFAQIGERITSLWEGLTSWWGNMVGGVLLVGLLIALCLCCYFGKSSIKCLKTCFCGLCRRKKKRSAKARKTERTRQTEPNAQGPLLS